MAKKITKIASYSLLAFVLLFIAVNIFPVKRPDPLFSKEELNIRGNLTSGNGFFIILGFMEPGRIDPQSREIVAQYINSYVKKDPISEHQILERRRDARKEIIFLSHVDYDQKIDNQNYFNLVIKNKESIKKISKYKFLMDRIERLLDSRIVEDLNCPDEETFPFLGLYWIELYLRKYELVSFIGGVDGDWLMATERLLKAVDLGQKISKSAKSAGIFRDGIEISSDALFFISEVLNRSPYNNKLYERVIQRLEKYKAFNQGLKYALMDEYFYLSRQIDVETPELPTELDKKIIRYFNAALYYITYNANRTAGEFNEYFIKVLNDIKTQPYKRTDPAMFTKDKNLFWWFVNFGGRFYLSDQMFNIYRMIDWYFFRYAKNDLVIILAMLHRDKVPYEKVQQYLDGLVKQGLINPFTGKGYSWDAKEQIIYVSGYNNEIRYKNSDKIHYRRIE